MKRLLAAVALTAAAVPALAADVGVSISIGQPGFYGQIDLGSAPRPVLVQPEPVIIQPAPREVRPVYLVVPPRHRAHWRHYCREYNACGRPVYFVSERWYNDRYVPYYREHREGRRGERDYDRREWRGRDGGDDHGPGRGHGRGHGRD